MQSVATQHYPTRTLYVVATPIGNLADISLGALHVLGLVDAIACEDTRHTQPLLRNYGIHSDALLAVHEHNEAQAAEQVIARLQRGERVAFVSDAGTPAVSDPGARLVALVRAAGLRVIPLPGASSVTTLLSAAGLTQISHDSGFQFVGFLPNKTMERDAAILKLQALPHALVLLEAPHRIEALAKALGVLGTRPITIGRELTKQFEAIDTLSCAQFTQWLSADSNRTRGEFALVLHPHETPQQSSDAERILKLLLAELPLKTAVKLAADITKAPRNELYEMALALKKSDNA
ncbi:MAG TPA: 16S rRNA (cytidine(1402)-2'-O)-methyltransferase [Burkholderiaceae bacterium]|nr:16S rRNA (cytidine(1402)-2'-O)-methyltransferase [Burkholderiaceae bacterium]